MDIFTLSSYGGLQYLFIYSSNSSSYNLLLFKEAFSRIAGVIYGLISAGGECRQPYRCLSESFDSHSVAEGASFPLSAHLHSSRSTLRTCPVPPYRNIPAFSAATVSGNRQQSEMSINEPTLQEHVQCASARTRLLWVGRGAGF